MFLFSDDSVWRIIVYNAANLGRRAVHVDKRTPDHSGRCRSRITTYRDAAMPEVTLGCKSRKFVVSTRALGARRNRESSRYTYLLDLDFVVHIIYSVLCTQISYIG